MEHATKGRPRSFDEDQAIDAAMRVFWEKSFEGTTMADLTDATGLSRSSIHAAFGGKEGLSLKARARYRSSRMPYIRKVLPDPLLPRPPDAPLHALVTYPPLPPIPPLRLPR